jgi:UDP-2,4-diacetamido-2,4,6-trideoxy-beta-L-altropyranose hydrolase
MAMVSPVIFRTDGGPKTGLGHVRRCLSLAKSLRELGRESFFILRGSPQGCQVVQAAGFKTMFLPPGADDLAETIQSIITLSATSIVVDSYDISSEYFSGLEKSGVKLAAIDDLADRELPVQLLINGSIGAKDLSYHCLEGTRYLLGPQYILLRPEFSLGKEKHISKQIRSVLISVGGSDPCNLTPRLMRWAKNILGNVDIKVVIGPFFQNETLVSAEVAILNTHIELQHDPENIYALMASSDLALCGGGQTTYELAAAGTPAVAVRVADNQTINLQGLEKAGVLVWTGDAGDLTLGEKVCHALESIKSVQLRQGLSDRGRELIDGKGADRVAHAIVELSGGQL